MSYPRMIGHVLATLIATGCFIAFTWFTFLAPSQALSAPLERRDPPACLEEPGEGLVAHESIPLWWAGESFPLWVLVDNTMPEYMQRQVLVAVDVWNLYLGERMLFADVVPPNVMQLMYILEVPNIVFTYELTDRPDLLGLAGLNFHHTTGRNWRGTVGLVPADISADKGLAVALHEFGHILGLRHDVDDPSSLMYPYAGVVGVREITAEDLGFIRSQRNCHASTD